MADVRSNLPVIDLADGVDGSTAPTETIQVGGKDSSGNLQSLNTDSSGDLYTKDLINVAGQYRAQSITTTAAEALGAATILVNRKVLTIMPTNGTVYFGFSNAVTSTTGTPIFKNQLIVFAISDNVHIFLISAGTVDCRVAEGS